MGDGKYAIEVKDLVKEYDGFKALNGISFKVKKGDAVGYLGPNGAGKTTTIKLLTNLLSPTSGDAYINGINVFRDSTHALRDVGALIEVPGMYNYMTPFDLMNQYGRIYRMDTEQIKRRREEVMKTVGLDEREDKKIDGYSTGMRRRLAIGLAIFSSPDILILDEPQIGLDPEGIKAVRELINSLKEKDITIFLSSHLLEEVRKTCDKVVCLYEGDIAGYKDVEKIMENAQHKKVKVEFLNSLSNHEKKRLNSLDGIDKAKVDGKTAEIYNKGDEKTRTEILSHMVENDFQVSSFSYGEQDLEDFYLSLIDEKGGD